MYRMHGNMELNLTTAAGQILTNNRLEYGLLISSKHKFIYLDNPKTGCSSIKASLIELEYRNTIDEFKIPTVCDGNNQRLIHNRAEIPFQSLSAFKQHPDPLKYLIQQQYYLFSLVRNPYTRLLSAYYNKIVGNKPLKQQILRLLYNNKPQALTTYVSLAEFIQVICSQPVTTLDPHWGLQSNLILFNVLQHDFIGKFENYAQDYVTIFTRLCNTQPIPKLRHRNSNNKNLYTTPITELITPRLQAAIYKQYQVDFENFGYAYKLPTIF